MTLSGLTVTNTYFVAPSSSVARQFISLANPGAMDKTVSVVISGNFGSDGATQVISTASGNTVVEAADRWIITDDANTTGADPAITTVFFGPGTPAVTPSAITAPAGTFNATYSVTVPAGQTKALLFFHQISPTAADATADANSSLTYWDTKNPVMGNDFLAGLTDTDLASVVNWSFADASIAPNTFSGGEGSLWQASMTGNTRLAEANIGTQTDAYDGSAIISIDGTTYSSAPTLSGNTASYPAVTLSGLEVTNEYFFAASSAVARQYVTLANTTATDKTITFALSGNFGSDAATQVITTASGNAVVEATDRWIITDDADTAGADPANTTVFFGPGTPTVTPSSIVAPTGTYTATYSVTIPAGQTKALLFFHQISPTASDATQDAKFSPDYWGNKNSVTGNDFLAGLTDAQLANVLNWSFTDATLTPDSFSGGEGSTWRVATSGDASLIEANIGSQGDAFDSGHASFTIDGASFAGVPTLAGNTASYPAVTLSGLNVSNEYFFAPSSSVARQLVSLANPGATDKTVSFVITGNLGSDGGTQVISSSNGNTTVEAADRWFVTDDANTTGGDPAITTVFFGTGSPTVTPSAITTPTSGNFTATYSVTIPAGQTKALLFFNQISRTAAEANLDDGLYFNNPPVIGNDLFQGLTALQRMQVVNYELNRPPVATDDTATVNEDEFVSIPVLANDIDPDGDTLTITGVTSGTNGTVAIDGSSVKYTPSKDFNGADTFTYTMTDGFGVSKTANVNVTITPVNDAPTISDILDQSTFISKTLGPIGFTIGDLETAVNSLTLSASSSNPAVVPNANVSFGGTGADRTVTIVPVAGQTGTSTITITVTDGNAATGTDTFLVNVRSPVALIGVPQFGVGTDRGTANSAILYNPDGSVRYTVSPFEPSFTGGVRTAAADFNNDGVADLIAGTGPGRATRVRILDGKTQAELFAVDPFESSFTGGVYVTAGDLNGDNVPDLVITPDEGGGPRVDVYSGAGFGKIASFFGIDDTNFRGGARAGTGDMNGDGRADLIVVAGFGGGPRVAGFDGTSIGGTPSRIFGDFFAFEQTLRNGIFVTVGDIDGDGFADLVAGGGPGGGPRVTVFSGAQLIGNTYNVLANFFGGDPNSRGGIRMGVKDLDGDTRADLVVGAGEGAGSRVTAYLGKNISVGTPPSQLDFDAFSGFSGGVFVG